MDAFYPIPVISDDNTTTTAQANRPTRTIRPMQRLEPMVVRATNTKDPKKRTSEYLKCENKNSNAFDNITVNVFARINQCYSSAGEESAQIIQLSQQLSLNEGLKKFGKKGRNTSCEEPHQMRNRMVFKPADVNSLTPKERKKDMESLMFLTKKRDRRVKD